MSGPGGFQAFSANQPSEKRTIEILALEDKNDEVLGHVIKQFPLSDLANCRRYILKRKLPELGSSGCVEYEGDDTAVTVPSSGQHTVVLGKLGTSQHIEFTFADGLVQSIYGGQNRHSAKYSRTEFGKLTGISHHWQSGFTEFSRWDSVDARGVLIPGRVDSNSTLKIGPKILWGGLVVGVVAIVLVIGFLKRKSRAS